MAEFAHNKSVNRATIISPFEEVISTKPRLLVDLVPLPVEARPSADADSFIHHMQQVHEEVWHHISASNDSYKEHADKHRRFVQFEEGDMVMLRNHPERLPPGTNKKLHPRNFGPFKILKKIGPSAYVSDLPPDLGLNATFNVEDLTLYKGHDQDSPSEEHEIQLPAPTDKTVDVLDY